MTLKGSLKEQKGPKEKENSQPDGSVRKWWELSPLHHGWFPGVTAH